MHESICSLPIVYDLKLIDLLKGRLVDVVYAGISQGTAWCDICSMTLRPAESCLRRMGFSRPLHQSRSSTMGFGG